MRTVVLRKRQDHDTSLLGSAAVALLIAAATAMPAQRVAAQAAVPCTAIADDAERLACYDRALRGAAPPAATQAPARSAAPPAQAPQRNAASTPVAPPAAAAEPRRERRVRESEAPPAPAAAAAPTAPRAGRDEADAGEVIPIVIVSTRALPGREMTFVAQDGTSWVQTDSQRITGLPDTPFDAEIKRGAMGSSFLVAKDRPRAIRVRPVR